MPEPLTITSSSDAIERAATASSDGRCSARPVARSICARSSCDCEDWIDRSIRPELRPEGTRARWTGMKFMVQCARC